MALVLMAKEFTLKDTTQTNNNQRSSSNPRNMHILEPGMNMDQDRQMLIVEDNVRNQFKLNAGQIAGIQNRHNVVQNVKNQNGNGNVAAAQAEGNGNGIIGIQLAPEEFDFISDAGTLTDNAPVYDSDGSAEKMALGYQNSFYLKQSQQKQQSLYNGKILLEKHDPPDVYDSDETLQLAQESRLKMKQLNKEIKPTKLMIDSLQEKLYDTIYENATLRARLFNKVFKQKNTTKGTSMDTKFSKKSILGKLHSSSGPKLYYVTPLPKYKVIPKVGELNALSKPVTSNSTPSPRESTVVNNVSVTALGIFRINPFKASRVDKFMPNKHVKARIKTKSITVSQPHVITNKDVDSNTNSFSPIDVKSTTRTRRPQPSNNLKNDKVPYESKSSCLFQNLRK
nr:hypothetical protein [Tanacetum cinerariifolium]GEZ08963.1 hypothetical protein [Tanacetum cinerariifolium]